MVLGLVKGYSTRARNISKDILAKTRTILGGELIGYTKLITESREQAIDRLIPDAKKRELMGLLDLS